MKYNYTVAQNPIFEDAEMMAALEEICVKPSAAKNMDIIGVELPYYGYETTTCSRVAVAHIDWGVMLLPWHTLVRDGHLSHRQIECIATVFACQEYNSNQSIFLHLGNVMGGPDHSALIIADGYGALVRHFSDDDPTAFVEEMVTDDASMQKAINFCASIALPVMTSNHMRAKHSDKIKTSLEFINMINPVFDPRTDEQIYPGIEMPS